MHILITGGTGFIGSKITNRLLMNGHKISAIIRPTSSTFNININHVNKLNLSFFYPDKLSSIFVAALPIDWVIHAATDYGYDRQKLENVHLSNVELPKNLLELCSKNKVNGFINLDTFFNSDKYQFSQLPDYVLTKKKFQKLGESIAKSNNFKFINLKLFHVYGPNDGPNKFVTKLILSCLKRESFDLTSGTQKRDFIYADDVVDAVLACLHTDLSSSYHTFDIGTGLSTSIKDVALLVNSICGNACKLNFSKVSQISGEPEDSFADLNQFQLPNWNAKTSLEDGLIETVKSFSQHV